jgi:hypothetical protein
MDVDMVHIRSIATPLLLIEAVTDTPSQIFVGLCHSLIVLLLSSGFLLGDLFRQVRFASRSFVISIFIVFFCSRRHVDQI